MTGRPIHILHLSEAGLRWAELEGTRRHPGLKGTGQWDDEPAACLERWASEHPGDPGDVYLIDSRPMVFSFTLQLPVQALRRLDDAVALKVRQELGLSTGEVYWATSRTRGARMPGGAGTVDVFTVVVRREAMRELEAWRERHGLKSLWIGADVAAVRSLVRAEVVPEPVVIVNKDQRGATVYHAGEGDHVYRGRLNREPQSEPSMSSGMDWNESTPRAEFGRRSEGTPSAPTIVGTISELARLPGLSATNMLGDFSRNGNRRLGGAGRLMAAEAGLWEFDAMVLGGVLEACASRPSMTSLLPGELDRPPLEQLTRRLNRRQLVLATCGALLLLALSLWTSRGVRGSARERLSERAEQLAPDIAIYRSERDVLKAIRVGRSPLAPVYQAIHRAAPAGVMLDSISITEKGAVQIHGFARDQNMPTTFFNNLKKEALLVGVNLQDFKKVKDNKFTFHLTGVVKERDRRR